ncbi:hypothetical protein AVEN_191331-1 [Araneus ventricosus]|uniref:Uncharacterized protein n=1 Tax=Araneus ventricosus TaxID=182803 RepID=A0A4Y2NYL1_ARAVE|nr:hypothetical protein AVEN_191331-1 [Araneus ventricosus]
MDVVRNLLCGLCQMDAKLDAVFDKRLMFKTFDADLGKHGCLSNIVRSLTCGCCPGVMQCDKIWMRKTRCAVFDETMDTVKDGAVHDKHGCCQNIYYGHDKR